MESSRRKEEEKPEANDVFRSFVAQLDDSVWRTDVARNENSEVKLALTLEGWYKLSEKRWKKKGIGARKETIIVSGLDGAIFSHQTSAWPLKPVDDMAQNVYDFVNSESTYSKERDFAGISLGIAGTSLSHAFDLDAFATQVYDVFQTYYDKQEASEYLGPYFVFVQSSGMGKTKILYEYARKVKSEQSDKRKASSETMIADDAKLVLCRARKGGERGLEEGSVFDCFIDFQGLTDGTEDFIAAVEKIFPKLNELLNGVKKAGQRLVLMFDEAQYLLAPCTFPGSGRRFTALCFRVVRLWICLKMNIQIVAVFTGTSTKLRNFKIRDDLESKVTDSREARVSLVKKLKFYDRGMKEFGAFYMTTTIGSLGKEPGSTMSYNSEYSEAVPFGRPLFAAMKPNDLSAGLATIVSRMVLDPSKWEMEENSWISILGTRVQMGQTPIEIASHLVGYGYMNLVGVNDKVARTCFMPDPVCARLAMCLMDENWYMTLKGRSQIQGQPKSWWVGKLKFIYSGDLCTPEKGDFGEIMVALYFLFCADVLRSPPYEAFSVSLGDWIHNLIQGGTPHLDKTGQPPLSKKQRVSRGSLSFGAIQVCRNYVRAYDNSWESLGEQMFLERLYKSGVGFYVFAGCKTIDLVFALKCSVGQDTTYIPLFVSVKSRSYFAPGDAQKECQKMKTKAGNANIGCALCLLVVFGSDKNTDDKDYRLTESCVEELSGEDNIILAKVLRVPTDDVFGLSKAFFDLTAAKLEKAEILSSHHFLGDHALSQKSLATPSADDSTEATIEMFAKKSLRSRLGGKDECLDMTRLLLKQLSNVTWQKRDVEKGRDE